MKNAIPLDLISDVGTLFVETTKGELYEVQKTENGYSVKYKDETFQTTNLNSVLFKKDNNSMIMIGDTPMQVPDEMLQCIIKGWNFAFIPESEDLDNVVSKGKIEKCFSKQVYDKGTLNIHFFEPKGRKYQVSNYTGTDVDEIIVKTRKLEYRFTLTEFGLFYNDKYVIALGSLFNIKNENAIKDLMEKSNYELDANFQYLMGHKPIIIITQQDKGFSFTLSYEGVEDIVVKKTNI